MGAVGCNGAMGSVRGLQCIAVMQRGPWGSGVCNAGCNGAVDTVGFTVVCLWELWELHCFIWCDGCKEVCSGLCGVCSGAKLCREQAV